MLHLNDRAVISVSGSEAKSFLQGLTTNDISKVDRQIPLYAALLTPQGKILSEFLLGERDGAVLIDCWAPGSGALLKRLTMYRLRAKVDLHLREDLAIAWFPEQLAAEDSFEDPRLPELGRRAMVSREPSAGDTDAAAEYLSHRLRLGVPEGGDFGSDKMFALDAGLEELHGVSFEKGCYVGQELTARMKHRGTARKRLLTITATDGRDLPPPGTEIRAAGGTIGEIASAYGRQGFGLIRLDRWKESSATPETDNRPLQIIVPDWLRIDTPHA